MTNNNNSILPKQFLNYINYELNICEKITHKKFFFNILSNDRFELSVCVTNDDEDIDNNIDNKYNKSKYQVIYRANNLHQFIKKLFMIKEHLIKNFGNGITTITL